MVNDDSVRAFIGTFRRLGGAGIYSVAFNSRSLQFGSVELAAEALDPIYLAFGNDQRVLYSVGATDLESREGLIVAYALHRDSSRLTEVDRRSSGGSAACHISLNEASGVVVVSNYLGGSVSAARLGNSGRFSSNVQSIQHQGSSVHPQRQTGPHPHSVTFDPSGKRAIACDLGTDQVLQYTVSDGADAPFNEVPRVIECERGAGPRHLVCHPSGRFVYVVNELASSVTGFFYTADEGLVEAFGEWTTLPVEWSGFSLPAAIRLSDSGDRLYVSNRGHNSIASFAVNSSTGALESGGHATCGGQIPRDFALTPDGRAMLVANEVSGSVVALAMDKATGLPVGVADQIEIPGAVSVIFGPA